MFKYIIVVFAIIGYTLAKPSVVAPLALHAAPLAVATAPIVTATSSQYQIRNHNHIVAAAPLVAAPVAVAAAPLAAAPLAAAPLATSYAVTNSWNLPYHAAAYVI